MMFGRSPPIHHQLIIEELTLLNKTYKSYRDALLNSLSILHNNAQRKQELFRYYSKKQHNKFRSPLHIFKGDLFYISSSYSTLLLKLSALLNGTYAVVKVYRYQDTNELTAVRIRMDNQGTIEYRTYSRYRIRVFKEYHLSTYWTNLLQEAEDEILHMADLDFVSPKSLDNSNIFCFIMSCLNHPPYNIY